MKRVIALAAFAAVAATLTGTAGAGSFKGVVVAKDAKRKAVVTASAGAVHTVRAKGLFGRLKVGERVSVSARALPDGTFSARAIRPAGKSGHVRFGAVVVRNETSRLIVSAGGSVFALHMRGRNTSSLRHDGVGPGDQVKVNADIKHGGLESDPSNVDQTGHVEMLLLEGIFLSPKGDGFDLAVVHRGLVHVTVPDGTVLPDLKAGDQIIIVVRVGDSGFTYVKGMTDERPHTEPSHGPNYGVGELVGKGPYSVSVRREDGSTLTCSVAAGLDLSIFRLGDKAKLYCIVRDAQLVLVMLRSESGWVKGDGSGELNMEGVLNTKDGGTVSARRVDGLLVKCSYGAALDMSLFRLGEKVQLSCNLEAGVWRFSSMCGENASIDQNGRIEREIYGAFQGRNAEGVAVRREDGTLYTCTAPDSLDLSYFHTNERVKLHCLVEGTSNVLLDASSDRVQVGADGSVDIGVYGTLASKTDTSLTVNAEDGTPYTCYFASGTDLSAFPLGTHVGMECTKLDGALQLEKLKSEHAELEIKH